MPPHFPRPVFSIKYSHISAFVTNVISITEENHVLSINNRRFALNRVQIVALAVSALLALAIFQLMRKKRLKEQYSLLWFLTVAVMLLLAVWESLLSRISNTIGISIPSNALFIMALLFLFVMSLHFSLLVSRLTDQSKLLAQKLALLERDLRRSREHVEKNMPEEDSAADD